MNYQKVYNAIINKAVSENRDKKHGYFEKHHILPKSLGGSNKKSNLVLLTAKEHFLAHRLLVEMYPNRSYEWQKMIYAASFFLASSKHHNREQISSRFYEQIKKTLSEIKSGIPRSEETIAKIKATKAKNPRVVSEEEKKKHSERMKGVNNPMFGKTHTKEVRDYISNLNKGRKNPRASEVNKLRIGKQLHNTREIEQYTEEGAFVATFISIAEAKRQTGITSIQGVLRGHWDLAGGYKWQYKKVSNTNKKA
jgi:hypothetical protein